jgi:phosphatidylserine/phosphatidylglycerophosphate/cardiolipin synthase-like enzyme
MPTDTVVLFSPRDNCHEALLTVLGSATVSINAAMFTLTDTALNAVLHAKAALPAPFEFQMTLDATEATTVAAMVPIVAGWVNDSRVVIGNSSRGNYSHDKLCVVDHLYVIDGSTNWTASGESYENNTWVCRRNAALAAWYETQLDAIYAYMRSKVPAPAIVLDATEPA